MPITPSQPITIPEKVLNKVWVTGFVSTSPGPNLATTLTIELIPYNEQGDVGARVRLDPIDVLHAAQTDPEAAQIYGRILHWVERKAKEEGKI